MVLIFGVFINSNCYLIQIPSSSYYSLVLHLEDQLLWLLIPALWVETSLSSKAYLSLVTAFFLYLSLEGSSNCWLCWTLPISGSNYPWLLVELFGESYVQYSWQSGKSLHSWKRSCKKARSIFVPHSHILQFHGTDGSLPMI